jgi:hypothetical protein
MSRSSPRADRHAKRRLVKSVQSAIDRLECRTLFSSAAFVKLDATTQGNWTGVYGADGYSVIGGSTSLPTYASFSVGTHQFYEWEAQNSSDARALQTNPSSPVRVAATDFAANTVAYKVNVTDGETHQVALYLLDQDYRGRSETITITDTSGGAVLASNDVSNFSAGDYAVYDISGNVTITVSADSGSVNAVVSGIFFDPGPGGSSSVGGSAGSATLLATDTTTQGNWTGIYGADGYSVIGGDTSLPAYATFGIGGTQFYQWQAPGTSEARALQVQPGDTQHVEATDYSNTVETLDLNLTDGNVHQVALYVLDGDSRGRSETVEISDASSGTVLSSTDVANFASGVYLVYDLAGHVHVTISPDSGSPDAVASGLFFDSGPGNRLSGTVFGDLNLDQVQETGELGFAGQTVTVTDAYDNPLATATTDSSGHYSIGGLPLNEQLNVTVSAPSGWVGTGGQVTLDGSGSHELSVAEIRLLPPPTTLTATASGSGEVDLSWTSNSAGVEEGFHVYESIDGAAFGTTPVATVGSGVTSTPITGLSASHDYAFEVAAYDSNGDSAPSNVADADAPGAPTGLVVESFIRNGEAYAVLTWNASDPSPAGTTYDVFVSQTPNSFTNPPVATGLTTTTYTYTYGPYDPSLTLYFAVKAVVPLPPPAITAAASGTLTSPPVLPPQSNTVTFYEGFNQGLIFVSPSATDGTDAYGQVPIPGFDSSLGTLSSGTMTIKDASAGMVWAPFKSAGYAFALADAFGYVTVGNDGLSETSDLTGGPNPYWHTIVASGTFAASGSPSQFQTTDHTDYCGGGPTVCMVELVGFVQVKYTYT